jgi:hypothetical protein
MNDSDELMRTALSPAQAMYVEGAYVGQQEAAVTAGRQEGQGGNMGIYMDKRSWCLCHGCTGVRGSCCCGGIQDAKGIVSQASSGGVSLEPFP